MTRYSKLGLILACSLSLSVLFIGCGARFANVGPAVKFTKIPFADEGGPDRLTTIEGRALGVRPGQRIVLFAQAGPWWVQPFANQPFTTIQPDSSWSGQTHFGTKYAALLVEPGYQPQPKIDFLPAAGAGVVVVAVAEGSLPFWQTRWFVALGVAALMLLVWSVYDYRLRQVEHEFRARVEARVGERMRIARELHDTLLQSFHGLLLSFQTAHDLLPSRSADAKETLRNAIDRAAEAISEGRDAVEGLRSSSVETNDLAAAIKAIGEELARQETNPASALFQVEVEGTPRNFHLILRDEVYRIAGEALRNAFRHAQARQIEVEIHYGNRQFLLRVRDDGRGIDPEILVRDGRAGHFGLHGMRERAQLVGGKLAVLSQLGSGTDIELTIPGATAYRTTPRRSWWFGRASEKWTDETETKMKS